MTFFARAKAPGASVAHTIDYSSDLGSGVTISSSAWAVTNGTEASSSNTDTTTNIEVSGGSLTVPIVATNTVGTSDGQTLTRSVTIPVDST